MSSRRGSTSIKRMKDNVDMVEPTQIYEDIQSYPPLMQEEIQARYRGQEVEWVLHYADGWVRGGRARLTFTLGEHAAMRFVTGDVKLAEFPWLKTLPAKETVRVRGRIREVDSIAINLDILELSVPEPATH